MRLLLTVFLSLGVLALPETGAGGEQSAPAGAERTAVSLQVGLSSGSSETAGAAVGGTIVQDLGSRLALEGSGSYLSRGMGSSALSLSANLLMHLRPRGERAVPYLAAGGGLYRASFDMGSPRFNGAMGWTGGMPMMGGAFAPSANGGFGQMPMFYANRFRGMNDGRAFGHRSFTDPALSVGGGIRIDLGSRLDLRPDGRALVVLSDGDTYTVGVFTVNFGFRF